MKAFAAFRKAIQGWRSQPKKTVKVLILSPVKDAAGCIEGYCRRVQRLTYPHGCISIGFLESDSSDTTYADLNRCVPRLMKEFGRVALCKTYDRNGWRDHGRLHLDGLRGSGERVELDTVGGTILLIRADLHRGGLIFPTFPYGRENSIIRKGGELETEDSESWLATWDIAVGECRI